MDTTKLPIQNEEELQKALIIKSVLPTVKEVREQAYRYADEQCKNIDEQSWKYAKRDFIEGAEWMRTQLVGKTVL